MKQKKFIISINGELRLGYVEYHMHLLHKGEDRCYGGGKYRIDKENKVIYLYDLSGDFGMPNFSMLKSIEKEYYDPAICDFIDISDYRIIYTDFLGEVTFEKNVKELVEP